MRLQVPILLATLALPTLVARPLHADAPRPNIVHIFADDLGWGSVGFNGQTQIATPNLDALAASGMRLDNAYSAPVCAPSRAVLYTGFHTGHAGVDGNDELSDGFSAQDVMTAQVLAPSGYTSAIFGKWGFGSTGNPNLNGSDVTPSINAPNSLPTNHGFDDFYGYLNHGAAHDYFYDWMWQSDPSAPNGVSLVHNNAGPGGTPQYSHDLIAAQSEQFVADHAADANPFYMQVNYTIPHWDIDAISNVPGGLGQYANMPWTPQQKEYAAMITRMDASIGSLIAKLGDPNGDGDKSDSLLSNTLIMFTSDNGPSTEDNSPIDFFNANGPYRGGKFEVYEGGIHMPAIASWQGTIAPGTVTDYRTDLADFMATAADLAGTEAPVGIDGTSLAPIFTGEGHLHERKYLVVEHQGAHGQDPDPRVGRWAVIRQDGMKLIRYDNETTELFNLNTDPGETSPLNLNTPANAQIAAELEADAIAEDVTRGSVQYRQWSGPSGGNLQDAAHWGAPTGPDRYWSAVVANAGAAPALAHVSADITTLGVEVKGQSALQVVNIHDGRTLTGLNEVRVGNHGRIDIDGGTLASSRWTNIRAGGEITGHGAITGDVYNQGQLSPGNSDATNWPVVAPPALPPISLNTGVTSAATFDFTGVQDDVPVAQTSTLSPYLQISHGLDFGPGVGPRWGAGGTDEGNELNVIGHTATSLAEAIADGDYVTFTVKPVDGAGVIPNSVSFNLWRNGGAGAKNFAILSSIDGFTSAAALVQATYTDTGVSHTHTLSANIPAVADALSGPIEYRLYSWGANAATGNTHFNAASLTAKFVSVPTLEFNFAGVQDNAPLTDLKRTSANLTLNSGLDFGPGVAASGVNNAGNELNMAGFSNGSTLQSAIDGNDYVSFTVQAVPGMTMFTDTVSFTLWRQAAGSATDYAIMSSLGGFASGQQVAQISTAATGAANETLFIGSFSGAQPTTAPVEFRLYGWNAASAQDDTHLIAASMRARFASIAGSQIDPTGALTVQGDFYHLAGGMLAIDLGGNTAGVDQDVVNVLGKADLEGNLNVVLAGAFSPQLGDTFTILTATAGVTGQFAQMNLPTLSSDLDWFVNYSASNVRLVVLASADFNQDGLVNQADLALWKTGFGKANAAKQDGDANDDGRVDAADFLAWQSQLGLNANLAAASHAVPEPAAMALLLTAAVVLRRRRFL
jgi:arylsulfatase A-like enzyme